MTHGVISQTYSYDGFGRTKDNITKVTGSTNPVLTETYTYNGNSSQVSSYKTSVGGRDIVLAYTYDDNGNILSVSDGTNTTTYKYDTAGQLVREDNQAAGKTWTWQYDNAGNIINRKEYAYTTATGVQADRTYTYTYPDPTDPEDSDWGDLLKSYDGRSYGYDDIGNPLSDGKRSYTWRNGREMHSVSQDGTTWFMAYNADGLRTKRVSTGTAYAYYYSGSQLRQMYIGSTGLYFRYDANGTPVSVTYGGTIYYYITNLQGDVTALVNASGEEVVSYIYDAWGKLLATEGSLKDTLGKHNPLRYRGYVYDEETGLYYLQSRYYDPEIGRFINADAFVSTGQGFIGSNMFAYCGNNPVVRYDVSGYKYGFTAGAIKRGATPVKKISKKQASLHADSYAGEVGQQVGKTISDWARGMNGFEDATGTFAIGATLTCMGGFGGSVSVALVADGEGGIGLMVTASLGAGLPTAGPSGFATVTNAPEIDNLSGWSGQLGGAALMAGLEKSSFTNTATGAEYQGTTYAVGDFPVLLAEIHTSASYSWVFPLGNVREWLGYT